MHLDFSHFTGIPGSIITNQELGFFYKKIYSTNSFSFSPPWLSKKYLSSSEKSLEIKQNMPF